MKKISEHLGEIIVAIACAVVIIGAVVAFWDPISNVIPSIVNKGFGVSEEASKPDDNPSTPNGEGEHIHLYNEWQIYNEFQHVRGCSCGATEQLAHEFGEWKDYGDGVYHVHYCTVCGFETGEPHDFGPDGSDDQCEDCGAEKFDVPEGHEHAFGDEAYLDYYYHAQTCSCGYTLKELHEWNYGMFGFRDCAMCGHVIRAHHCQYEDADEDRVCDMCGGYVGDSLVVHASIDGDHECDLDTCEELVIGYADEDGKCEICGSTSCPNCHY